MRLCVSVYRCRADVAESDPLEAEGRATVLPGTGD